MLNIGMAELMVIGVLVIVFVGPDDLPELMRWLGRGYGKLRRASDDLRRAFQLEVDKVDAEARAEEIERRRAEMQARREARRAEIEAKRAIAPQPRKDEAFPVADGEVKDAEEPAPAEESTADPNTDNDPSRTEAAREALAALDAREAEEGA